MFMCVKEGLDENSVKYQSCMKCKGYYFVGVCAQRGYKRHIDSPSAMSGLRYFSRQVS
jgi:hypothetical protein